MQQKQQAQSTGVGYFVRQISPMQWLYGIVILLLISLFFYKLSRDLATGLENDLRTAFDQQNLTVVDIASSRVGFHIANDVAENVRLLGQFPAMQRLELHNGTRDMGKVRDFAAPRVDGFVLFDADGNFFTAYPESMRHLYEGNQSETPFFKMAKKTSTLYFSNWIHDGEHLKMRVSAPVFDRIVDKNFRPPKNKLAGVVMAQIDFNRTIASELTRLKATGLMHWIIDEETGEVLYHSILPRIEPKGAVDSDKSALAKSLLHAFSSRVLEPGVHRTQINGKGFSIASARSTVGPHRIIVNLAYDDSEVTSLVHDKTNRIYMLAFTFFIMILLGMIITLKQMSKRRDLTNEKEHLERELALEDDKKKLSEQVFQLQKMESLGELAAGTAHELNNALSDPMGMLSILQIKPNMDADKRQAMIDKIVAGMGQARSIVEGLLRFSRSERNEKQLDDVNEDIRFIINMYEKECEHAGIQLYHNLQDHLPQTFASHRQIQQVLLNLITNAKFALDKGGILEVSSHIQHKNGAEWILIQVKDDGVGMSKEIQQRIFEPFFSTKAVGEGTGLGLSICYGIIQNHKGVLEVESSEGVGTTFSIWLPITKAL